MISVISCEQITRSLCGARRGASTITSRSGSDGGGTRIGFSLGLLSIGSGGGSIRGYDGMSSASAWSGLRASGRRGRNDASSRESWRESSAVKLWVFSRNSARSSLETKPLRISRRMSFYTRLRCAQSSARKSRAFAYESCSFFAFLRRFIFSAVRERNTRLLFESSRLGFLQKTRKNDCLVRVRS